MTTADKTELASLLNEIRTVLDQKKSALLANGGQEDYQRGQHDVVVAQQLNHMLAISPSPSPGIPADGDAMVSARNEAMTDNVRWLLEQEGAKGRILVFAHNMHVMNSMLQGGPWAKFRHPSSSTGQFLRSALGSEVVIIGGTAASESHKLISLPDLVYDPAWSPDGSLIRFRVGGFTSTQGSLWQVSVDGTNLHPLLPGWRTPPVECCGKWTTHGKYFVFGSGGNVWALAEKGKWFGKSSAQPVQLTSGPMSFCSPLPSKDGKKLFVMGALARG